MEKQTTQMTGVRLGSTAESSNAKAASKQSTTCVDIVGYGFRRITSSLSVPLHYCYLLDFFACYDKEHNTGKTQRKYALRPTDSPPILHDGDWDTQPPLHNRVIGEVTVNPNLASHQRVDVVLVHPYAFLYRDTE